MKILIQAGLNRNISHEAMKYMADLGSKPAELYFDLEVRRTDKNNKKYYKVIISDGSEYEWWFNRTDPVLIQAFEKFGNLNFGAGELCEWKIVDIPDDVKWETVCAETGQEYVREISREWH